jgi:hypothetical protein
VLRWLRRRARGRELLAVAVLLVGAEALVTLFVVRLKQSVEIDDCFQRDCFDISIVHRASVNHSSNDTSMKN